MTKLAERLSIIGCLIVAPAIGWFVVFKMHVNGGSAIIAVIPAVLLPTAIGGVFALIGGYRGGAALALAAYAGMTAAAVYFISIVIFANALRDSAKGALGSPRPTWCVTGEHQWGKNDGGCFLISRTSPWISSRATAPVWRLSQDERRLSPSRK